ncbi:MAG TPA: SDR family oxidoreductase [Terracidiphilus sp.]|nr:SDR family oxidoreductase [Terracidiphilus sp.]
MGSSTQVAFVTGSTGLLGNHLVRHLLAQGFHVRALARTRKKADVQFAGLPVEIVIGDVTNVPGFVPHLHGVDVLFHTAAYFRESFQGGRHRDELFRVNVEGTRDLLLHAYGAGVRRFVHTSSAAVLIGKPGQLIDETMSRPVDKAEDYPRSKIQADQEVVEFLRNHPDASGCMVLPGWMFGPGDIGPTSSGQLVLDFLHGKLPGIPPAEFTVADARDVAEAHVAAALKGRRGERYLMAGRCMEMAELFALLEHATGVPAPRRKIPIGFLYAFAAVNEAWHFFSGKPVLIGLSAVRLMAETRGRIEFNSSKAEREFGVSFRPAADTLRDTANWYRQNGWDSQTDGERKQLRPTGDSI